MKAFHKRLVTELAISLIIIGAMALGLLFFGFNIIKFSKKIVSTRQELYDRSVSIESLATLRSDYTARAKNYLNVLYNVVPLKDELIDLSKDFSSLASGEKLEYGFTFVGESPATSVDLGSVEFNLTLGGTLERLLSFVENLQNFRYLINLDSLSLVGGAEQMKMSVRGKVFFR